MIVKNLSLSVKLSILFLIVTLFSSTCFANDGGMVPFVVATQSKTATTYNMSIKVLLFISALTLLPAILMTMTAFTRIVIVLAILRQALGIPNVPSNQILVGLSLMMTLFVMMPLINKVNTEALQPYLANSTSEQAALETSGNLLKGFMLKQTRRADLRTFQNIAKVKVDQVSDTPLLIVMPAYLTSELKTAFQIGFLIFLPFLIIDLVISSVLMSMGMMMLSPMVISLPFKLLFFTLLDGWSLIVTNLITSFRV